MSDVVGRAKAWKASLDNISEPHHQQRYISTASELIPELVEEIERLRAHPRPKVLELPATDDVEKLKAAYLAIKALDSDAIVVTANYFDPRSLP